MTIDELAKEAHKNAAVEALREDRKFRLMERNISKIENIEINKRKKVIDDKAKKIKGKGKT